MKLRQMSDSILHSYLVYTQMMAEQLEDVNLETATEEDMKDIILWIEGRDIAEATKQDYRKTAKRFFKWRNGGEEFPDKIDWLKSIRKRKDEKIPEKML